MRSGPWNPHLDPGELQVGLRHMLLTRMFDDRMQRTQRAGKISFYMRSLGEEAVSVAQCMALQPGDMLFPSYRNQGLHCARRRALVDLMCQLPVEHARHVQGAAATGDVSLQGRQYLFDLRKSGDAISTGGRLGHGSGDQGGGPSGRGLDRAKAGTAEADFHYACCLPPCTRRRSFSTW